MMRQSDVRAMIRTALKPLHRSVRLMMTAGEIVMTDAAHEIQTVQVKGLDGELLGAAQYPQHWGFTSRPLKGSTGFLGSLFGTRNKTILLGSVDARWRPKDLAEGESCLFDDQGQRIYLRRDKVHVISPFAVLVETPAVTLDAAQTTMTGNLKVEGDVQVDGAFHADGAVASDTDVTVGDISLPTHCHSNVQNGAGTSGGPVA